MLKIKNIRMENAGKDVVTDERQPEISFALYSDRRGSALERYRITVSTGGKTVWDSGERQDKRQISILYEGESLKPFTRYQVEIQAWDQYGQQARGESCFSTGRLDLPWAARWITDPDLPVPEKSSPVPLLFRRKFNLREKPVHARLCATALGIYELEINGRKPDSRYFAPGFTSYLHQIQYQYHDISNLRAGENLLLVRVGAGWAVGAFTTHRTCRTYADTPCLLLELRVEYRDGTEEIIGTDTRWEISRDGRMRFADWYDGEVYDATIDEERIPFQKAQIARLRSVPRIMAEYGAPVEAVKVLEPVSVCLSPGGEIIYDFGENFAGVISVRINGKAGQKAVFRHAEVLVEGELSVKPLRTAKARVEYTAREGMQSYSPTMTYMGFRYVGVTGISREQISLSAVVLSSRMDQTGTFSCSDERLNRLHRNILRSARSNFMDIPTDCPQRDERMGWTGDLAVFASTACFNLDMSRFLNKWLLDLSSEQAESGALPMTVPRAGDTWKIRAVACWGDACVLVPWAEYLSRGDTKLLRRQYPVMKKFLGESLRRASLFSLGKHRRIWSLPFQFGDWCAPGEDYIRWISKGKWVATAYLANSCRIVSQIGKILGEEEEAAYYGKLFEEISDAYLSILCRKDGRLKKEFQTAYVLPLAFKMVRGGKRKKMAQRLKALIEEGGYAPRTGFPGTPYLLFALADNGESDTAYKTLMNEDRPGWLYALRSGATTIWERWDALKEDGSVNLGEQGDKGEMVSFNHYANGSVGDFLYRRIAGLEPVEGGYRTFRVAPVTGGGITDARARVMTPYGPAGVAWKTEEGKFTIEVEVPVSTTCILVMPGGGKKVLSSGRYRFSQPFQA